MPRTIIQKTPQNIRRLELMGFSNENIANELEVFKKRVEQKSAVFNGVACLLLDVQEMYC